MLYEDAESGLSIRRIDYDSKDEACFDIRVIDSHVDLIEKLNLPMVVPKEMMKCWHIGTSQRLNRIENPLDFKVYIILDGQFMVATASTSRFETYYPVILAGTVPEHQKRIADVYFALARMLKNQGFENVYAAFLIREPAESVILTRAKRFVMNSPKTKPYLQLWELNI